MLSVSTIGPTPPTPGLSSQLPLPVLFNAAFMRQYTNDETVTAFFARSGYVVLEWNDLQAIEKGDLDAHVRRLSRFPSWLGMVDMAVGFFFADMYQRLAE